METLPVTKSPLNFAPFEVELEKICSVLNISTSVKGSAKSLLLLSECHSLKYDDPKFIVVSALFIALQEQKIVISLSDILQTANLRLYDFLEHFERFLESINKEKAILSKLKISFVMVNLLFENFTRLFTDYFGSPSKKELQQIFKFGWLFFLVLKQKAFLKCFIENLQTLIHLQICVIYTLFVHMPAANRLQPLNIVSNKIVQLWPFEDPSTNVLKYICYKLKANHVTTQEIYNNLFKSRINELQLRKEPSKIPPPQVSSCLYFGGLLDMHLSDNIQSLKAQYDTLLESINETLLVEESSTSSLVLSPLAKKRKTTSLQDMVALSPAAKLLHGRTSETPSEWLSIAIEDASFTEAFPETLSTILEKSGLQNLTEPLLTAVQKWIDLVEINDGERYQAVRLYYHLLHKILMSEEKRLSKEEFEKRLPKLIDEQSGFTLHCEMLSVCVQVVIFCAYHHSNYEFPYILNKFQIQPYTFLKWVECLVHHEKRMHPEILAHLVLIEENILSRLAWLESSPIFTEIDRPYQNAAINKLFELDAGLATKLYSEQPMEIALQNPKANYLDSFFKKLSLLISLRSYELAQELCKETSNDAFDDYSGFQSKIELAVMHFTVHDSELMRERTIDQLIIACVFGISQIIMKNMDDKLTLQTLTECYMKTPSGKLSNLFNIKLNQKTPEGETMTGTIVDYINKVFLASEGTNHFLYQLGASDLRELPNNITSFKCSTPQRLKNIYLSPLKSKLSGTPSQREPLLLTASPKKIFKKINNAMARPTVAKKKLDFADNIPVEPHHHQQLQPNPSNQPHVGHPPFPEAFPPVGLVNEMEYHNAMRNQHMAARGHPPPQPYMTPYMAPYYMNPYMPHLSPHLHVPVMHNPAAAGYINK
jgi:hypothetical protein